MRILDEDNDRPLKRVMLFLTIEEAKSLPAQLGDLIARPKLHHAHIEDDRFTRGITIGIYTPSNLSQFDERSRKLIEEDE